MQDNVNIRRLFLTSISLSPVVIYISWIVFKRQLSRPIFYKFECDGKPVKDNKRVLLVGDSRVSNWRTYPNAYGYEFVSRGVGGEKIESLINRLPFEVSCYEPDIIIFQIGINDAVAASLLVGNDQSSFLASFERAITILLQFCKRANINCYLSTIIKPSYASGFYLVQGVSKISSIVEILNQSIKSLSIKYSVMTLDFSAALLDSKTKLTNKVFRLDTLHINDNAYSILNDQINKLVTPLNSAEN